MNAQPMCGVRPAQDNGNLRVKRLVTAFAYVVLSLGPGLSSQAYAQRGWVREYTGQISRGLRLQADPPCLGGTYCQYWQDADRNAFTRRIAAGGGYLYQLQGNGAIFQYPTAPCTDKCPGWWQINDNQTPTPKAIYVLNGSLYKIGQDGNIWRFTNNQWEKRFNTITGSRAIALAGGGGSVAALYENGGVGADSGYYAYSSGDAVSIAVDGHDHLYRLLGNGAIQSLPLPFGGSGWVQLDNNPKALAIAATTDDLYQLRDDGSIWRLPKEGGSCFWVEGFSQLSCSPWEKLDNNPATVRIFTSNQELYQLHASGAVWHYTGTTCDPQTGACNGWEILLGDGAGRLAADGDHLYALSEPVVVTTHERTCYDCIP